MMRSNRELRNLDLNVLIIFEAIYDAGNVTRAARLLGMNQATVSNALSRLRAHFGDPLFRRAANGVAPTPMAEELIEPIRNALALLRDGLLPPSDFDHAHANRQFCLAINDFAAETMLPRLIARFQTEAPGIRLKVLNHYQRAPIEALLAGEADVIVDPLGRKPPGVELKPIHSPSAAVIARTDHPLIRGSINKEQFGTVGHVGLALGEAMRSHAEAQLMAHGIHRKLVCEVANCLLIPGIVAASDLVAMVPGPFARAMEPGYRLQVLKLPFASMSPRLYIGIRSETAKDAGLAWLCRELRRAAEEVTPGESWLD